MSDLDIQCTLDISEEIFFLDCENQNPPLNAGETDEWPSIKEVRGKVFQISTK